MRKNSTKAKFNTLRAVLLQWYNLNKRALPWRKSTNAYHIWLSEIILQQTRVNQGLPYYLKFIESFPDVFKLAEADEQQVLRLWQGLGYYSRARNMHAAANQVVNDYGGEFPQEYEKLLKLKGVGSYTAAAIASIAFKKPVAVLDGNVYRVLSRLFALETPINSPEAKKIYTELAQHVLDKQNAGDFNEAMMELGATVCTPQNPLCTICPVNQFCDAFELGLQNKLPFKLPKKTARNRYFHYLLIYKGEKIYFNRREKGDIWQGLYDLPMTENENAIDLKPGFDHLHIYKVKKMLPLRQITHQLTHQTLYINFYLAEAEADESIYILKSRDEINDLPLPRPIDIFLKEYFK